MDILVSACTYVAELSFLIGKMRFDILSCCLWVFISLQVHFPTGSYMEFAGVGIIGVSLDLYGAELQY